MTDNLLQQPEVLQLLIERGADVVVSCPFLLTTFVKLCGNCSTCDQVILDYALYGITVIL